MFKEMQAANVIQNGVSVIDVGCGLGHQMRLIKDALPGLFARVEGIDWSPATVAKHQNDQHSVYDKVTLCGSDKLPCLDQDFDFALSMENLEHLYGDRSIGAISEMMRVARRLIVTTPLPSECINFAWIYPEIVEAILDDVPLSEHDFICLESAVHKSTVFPSSMVDAGFTHLPKGHGYYCGNSSAIDVSLIKCVGVDERAVYAVDAFENSSLKTRYLKLLAHSVELHKSILASPHHQAMQPALQPTQQPVHVADERKRSWMPKIFRGK
ncbi:MAG: methyltransferase domain-containing protein [Burkholderiales bacterium]|nr:methyltransferase domain-containing protein [Burkholderiales bacterium]MBH2015119.1 methyltransferase domain-containing protein [Burkholderiales bacterium]